MRVFASGKSHCFLQVPTTQGSYNVLLKVCTLHASKDCITNSAGLLPQKKKKKKFCWAIFCSLVMIIHQGQLHCSNLNPNSYLQGILLSGLAKYDFLLAEALLLN